MCRETGEFSSDTRHITLDGTASEFSSMAHPVRRSRYIEATIELVGSDSLLRGSASLNVGKTVQFSQTTGSI